LIKINLLATDRERPKRKATFQIAGQKLTIACSMVLVLATLVVGWWFWALQRQSADLDQQIETARQETARLRNVIQQVRQFEARRAQLQQRVTLIEQLRKGQNGPVHLLDQVSRVIPDTMWLTEMRQAGGDVMLDGRCTSLTALSDFVSGLTASGLFQPPVEIIDSRVEPPTTGAPELIRFSVRAKLTPATPAAAAN
jgi:type IV pilus assembly protein PilN